MAFPDPVPGLVLSYQYLWHWEYAQGQDNGRKNRPAVVVLHLAREAPTPNEVVVVPITRTPPANPADGVEIPAATRQRLGMSEEPCWAIVTEINRFSWPGPDLVPLPDRPEDQDRYSYGMLPPALFEEIKRELLRAWREGRKAEVQRTE